MFCVASDLRLMAGDDSQAKDLPDSKALQNGRQKGLPIRPPEIAVRRPNLIKCHQVI
jgi:hypothetical protein